jgi:hypothetical protein
VKGVSGTGFALLGVWLIIMGLVQVINLHFSGLGLLQGVLALVAGILILLGR